MSSNDLKSYLDLLPEPLRDAAEAAIDRGLVDNEFTWDDLRGVSEAIAGIAGVAAIFATGRDAAIDLATNNAKWIDEVADAASLAGRTNRFRNLHTASSSVPQLRGVSSDVIRAFARTPGSRFDDVLQALTDRADLIADLNARDELIELIVKRADGAELAEALGESDMLALPTWSADVGSHQCRLFTHSTPCATRFLHRSRAHTCA